jgi:uncharacterized protein (TIGR04255 family)
MHFVPGPLTVLDVANWVETFNDSGLDVQQHAALPAAPFAPGGLLPPMPFVIGMPGGLLPRIFLRRDDVSDYFVFQNDRIAFGWHRTDPVGEEAAYPGYDELRKQWRPLLGRFNEWLATRPIGLRPPRLIELSYQNAFPLGGPSGGQFVPPFFKLAGLKDKPMTHFQLAWREVVPNASGGYVDAMATFGAVPPAAPAFLFNFVGIAPVETQATIDDVLSAADRLHSHISGMYDAAIAEEDL